MTEEQIEAVRLAIPHGRMVTANEIWHQTHLTREQVYTELVRLEARGVVRVRVEHIAGQVNHKGWERV